MVDVEQAKKIIGRYSQIFGASEVYPAHALHRAINEVLSEAGPRLNGEQAVLALESMKAHAWDPVVLMKGINECLGIASSGEDLSARVKDLEDQLTNRGNEIDSEWVSWAKEHLSLKHPERAGVAEVRTALVAALQDREELRALRADQERSRVALDAACDQRDDFYARLKAITKRFEDLLVECRPSSAEAVAADALQRYGSFHTDTRPFADYYCRIQKAIKPTMAEANEAAAELVCVVREGMESTIGARVEESVAHQTRKPAYHKHTGERVWIPKDADPEVYDCYPGETLEIQGPNPERQIQLRESRALRVLINRLSGIEHDAIGSLRQAAQQARSILDGE